ncbi:methylamine utilization protein [Pseudoalteromonas xiamenensis]|uniref:methylamine utilization protein n=1 Tax=Pseudoalteromonas xiamenensis TaxID=882626 RepID=UPI0027E51F1D|nr:methylamine utilization protein [Pseudoalteromonas xiamenensis]WMN61376.1 methylamine utilization protein [Pseudoalteromonas xiamenensis]
MKGTKSGLHGMENVMKIMGLLLLTLSISTHAVTVSVTDKQGQALQGAVVWMMPKVLPAHSSEVHYEMGQKNRTFQPHILAVPAGANVDFPNFDNILHHVYSFSDTKPFELKLYRDKPHAPIQFESAGIVELGCNIHDWMLGYIVVVDGPYFGVSNAEGVVELTIPDGHYQPKVWHEQFEELNLPETLAWQELKNTDALSFSIKQNLVKKIESMADEFDEYE